MIYVSFACKNYRFNEFVQTQVAHIILYALPQKVFVLVILRLHINYYTLRNILV